MYSSFSDRGGGACQRAFESPSVVVKMFVTQEIEQKFKEAVKLNDEESTRDPESEPYKSKYAAREIWHDLKSQAKKRLEDGEDTDLTFLIACLDLRLGTNYIETEELSSGEELLSKCMESLDGHRLEPNACNILQNALNQLGILWTLRGKAEQALEILLRSQVLYKDFKHKVGNNPCRPDELFELKGEDSFNDGDIQKRVDNFESTYTHTLYYIAQVYGKLEKRELFAEYCHMTLHRQLDTKKYEPYDWAINAATLSQYYITESKFGLARHCLASACTILQEVADSPENLEVEVREEESQDELHEREKFPKAWADLYRCWIKYGLGLLEYSRDRLFESLEESEAAANHNADKQGENDANKTPATNGSEESDSFNQESEGKGSALRFELELTSVENEITDQPILVFEEARQVFTTVQKWIQAAKQFYVIDGHCTDYVELIQDHSKLYKLLAFFEGDFERQSRMHKRRVDILQGCLKELSPQFYMLICRQLMYELAETYSGMLDIKLTIVEQTGQPPNQHAMNKMNTLAYQSIQQYHSYLDTLKTSDKMLPKKYSTDDERPALVAHFCIGRLYSKFLEFDIAKRLGFMKKSVDNYKYIVDYCKTNPESVPIIKSELEICEEMVVLLPAKMDKVLSGTFL